MTDAEAKSQQGNEHVAAKRYSEAIDCYTAAVSLAPDVPKYSGNLSQALLSVKRYADAEAAANRALDGLRDAGPTAFAAQRDGWVVKWSFRAAQACLGLARPEAALSHLCRSDVFAAATGAGMLEQVLASRKAAEMMLVPDVTFTGSVQRSTAVPISSLPTAMTTGVWYSGMAQAAAYQWFVDSCKLHVEDSYSFGGDLIGAYADGAEGGGTYHAMQNFKYYMRKAHTRRDLLPEWWSDRRALSVARGEAGVRFAMEKDDVTQKYGSMVPMAMRMVAEQVTGRSTQGGMFGGFGGDDGSDDDDVDYFDDDEEEDEDEEDKGEEDEEDDNKSTLPSAPAVDTDDGRTAASLASVISEYPADIFVLWADLKSRTGPPRLKSALEAIDVHAKGAAKTVAHFRKATKQEQRGQAKTTVSIMAESPVWPLVEAVTTGLPDESPETMLRVARCALHGDIVAGAVGELADHAANMDRHLRQALDFALSPDCAPGGRHHPASAPRDGWDASLLPSFGAVCWRLYLGGREFWHRFERALRLTDDDPEFEYNYPVRCVVMLGTCLSDVLGFHPLSRRRDSMDIITTTNMVLSQEVVVHYGPQGAMDSAEFFCSSVLPSQLNELHRESFARLLRG